MIANIVWGAPDWVLPSVVLLTVAAVFVVWSYARTKTLMSVRCLAGMLKLLGLTALAICLVEPLLHSERPQPGANMFIILADSSESLQVADKQGNKTRAERVQTVLKPKSSWQSRLGQDFELRRYSFDNQLRSVTDFSELSIDGAGSALHTALGTLARRFRKRPVAGILLFTDGNATDWQDPLAGQSSWTWAEMPPVFPVVLGGETTKRDIRLGQVSVSHSNFEQAPVTIRAELTGHGYQGREIVVQLLDHEDQVIEEETIQGPQDGRSVAHRFQVRPPTAGVHFYRVRAIAKAETAAWEDAKKSREATLANNTRHIAVNRREGPYRILYVSGRPNWEFKFLNRAVHEDEEIQLAALLRIAKREPKFVYLGRDGGNRSNPLFRGAEDGKDETAESYDQPVLLRLGVRDESELRDGFPKTADVLYGFDAVVLDDLEAEFFTRDQMTLLHHFVSRRGGGLIMLGGQESFVKGQYQRTPIGELLPVYLDKVPPAAEEQSYKLALNREGWLQPWMRLRVTEDEEKERLAKMAGFLTLNRISHIKPGAQVLAHATNRTGDEHPALVTQRFGRGRTAAVLIGDLWRWGMRREEEEPDDLARAWRQMMRWIVADVPRRVEIEVQKQSLDAREAVQLLVRVSDEEFQPLDNAKVKIGVTTPGGESVELTAEASLTEAGVYHATFAPREAGPYLAHAVVSGADQSDVGEQKIGWTAQPKLDEFQSVELNRQRLTNLAAKTNGQVIQLNRLDRFVADLPNRKVPITEPRIDPIWHHWMVFVFAISCFIAEWGLRRWKGLA